MRGPSPTACGLNVILITNSGDTRHTPSNSLRVILGLVVEVSYGTPGRQ